MSISDIYTVGDLIKALKNFNPKARLMGFELSEIDGFEAITPITLTEVADATFSATDADGMVRTQTAVSLTFEPLTDQDIEDLEEGWGPGIYPDEADNDEAETDNDTETFTIKTDKTNA